MKSSETRAQDVIRDLWPVILEFQARISLAIKEAEDDARFEAGLPNEEIPVTDEMIEAGQIIGGNCDAAGIYRAMEAARKK